jgi:hypothetical protein
MKQMAAPPRRHQAQSLSLPVAAHGRHRQQRPDPGSDRALQDRLGVRAPRRHRQADASRAGGQDEGLSREFIDPLNTKMKFVYMKPGDLSECTYEGIGTLTNPIVAEGAKASKESL